MNILFVGPVEPPINGQSLAFTKVYNFINCKHKLLVDTNYKVKSTLLIALLNIKNIIKMIYYILYYRVDVIYFTCSRNLLGSIRDVALITVANLKNTRVVNHLHGSDFYDFIHSTNKLYKNILFHAYRNVDTSIVLLDSMRGQFSDFPSMKVEVVPNFYEEQLDFVKKGCDNRKGLHILYLSNLIKSKGIFELIEAFNSICDVNDHIFLNVAGGFLGDEYMSSSEVKKKFFEKIMNNQRIIYHGVAQGDHKINLLYCSDIFVLPSYFSPEAFPISIIEGMRSGNAILVTDHKYLPEIVSSQSGLIVKKGSSEDIAVKLNYLINDRNYLKSIQQYNIEYAKINFSQNKFLDKISAILIDEV